MSAPYQDEPENECAVCGGERWSEVDDPINDDCDEWGVGICPHCNGSGQEP